MENGWIQERRLGRDRRIEGVSPYAGPERRSGFDRRKGLPPVCAYCGRVLGGGKSWTQGASTVESTVESMMSICTDCSRKRFPRFYSDN